MRASERSARLLEGLRDDVHRLDSLRFRVVRIGFARDVTRGTGDENPLSVNHRPGIAADFFEG